MRIAIIENNNIINHRADVNAVAKELEEQGNVITQTTTLTRVSSRTGNENLVTTLVYQPIIKNNTWP